MLAGDAGNDTIIGGSGRDEISGGRGDDRIDAVDSRRDRISGGAGRDSARTDHADQVSSIEVRLG